MKFKTRFEDKGLKKKVQRIKEKGQFILDEQVLKDSNYYAPMDSGELIRSGVRMTNPGSGKVIWQTPYARKLYYNPDYNFSTDKNPNAQGLWFLVAKSRHLNDWIRIIKSSL